MATSLDSEYGIPHGAAFCQIPPPERTFLQRKSETLSSDKSTLHHIALNIDLEDYESELTRLQELGLDVRSTEHPWLQVRSLYFHDPEGNTLELVCYDEQVG